MNGFRGLDPCLLSQKPRYNKKSCGVREDCCTFHTFSSSNLVTIGLPRIHRYQSWAHAREWRREPLFTVFGSRDHARNIGHSESWPSSRWHLGAKS